MITKVGDNEAGRTQTRKLWPAGGPRRPVAQNAATPTSAHDQGANQREDGIPAPDKLRLFVNDTL